MTTHTEREGDLDREFRAIAHALVHDTGSPRPTTIVEMPRRAHSMTLVAAVLLVATGIGGVFALTRGDTTRSQGSTGEVAANVTPTTMPPDATATTSRTTNPGPFGSALVPYPHSDLLDGLGISGRIFTVGHDIPSRTQAVLAKMNGDTVVDLLTITAGPGAAPPANAHLGTGVVEGYAVATIGDTTTAYRNEIVPLSISGSDPVPFLSVAPDDFVTPSVDDAGTITLSFADLPTGYSRIGAQTLDRDSPWFFLSLTDDRGNSVGSVSVDPNNPMLNQNLTDGQEISRTTVGGQPAWALISNGLSTIVWEPVSGRFAWVQWNGPLDEAVEIATATEFSTDVDAWMTQFDVPQPDVLVDVEPTTTAVMNLDSDGASPANWLPCPELAADDEGTPATVPAGAPVATPVVVCVVAAPGVVTGPTGPHLPTATTVVIDQSLPESRFSQTALPS